MVQNLVIAGIGALLAYLGVLLWRWRTGAANASVSPAYDTLGGYSSFVVSGTHLTVVVVSITAALVWPVPIEEPIVGGTMVSLILGHIIASSQGWV